MSEARSTKAEAIAQAAIAFQRECTGVTPPSVSVMLGEDTLVITLHDALSPAEKLLARTPEGAAQVADYHRQLFRSSAGSLHSEVQRILGVEVRESTLEMETVLGRLVEVFPSGSLVQVFRLAHAVAPQTWSTPKMPPAIAAT